MDRLRSGGFAAQAWAELLSSFSLTPSSPSPSPPTSTTISTGLLAASLAVVPILLTFFIYTLSNTNHTAKMANGPITNGSGAAPNGKPADPSADFRGDIRVDDKPPTKEQLETVAGIHVLDANKKSHTFKSLYANNERGPRRVLVAFIRHFFCGVCQEYVRVLSESIPPSTLTTLSPPTEIVIVGCGSPNLIPMYTRESACAFPIYADPTRRLYNLLGMTSTLSLGPQSPDYMRKGLVSVSVRSFFQELKSGRRMLSGGDYRQVGGEFLFANDKVSWCHRMRNTRDHAEVAEVRRQLRLDEPLSEPSDGETPRARKRWSTAGLGAGLGRRLSNRRRSWAPSRSRSRNPEVKGSPVRSTMEGVKEEETATNEDALAKLEGKAPQGPTIQSETTAPPNSTTNELAKQENPHNGTPINGTAHEPLNENEAKVEEKILTGAADGMVNGLTHGTTTANGHVAA